MRILAEASADEGAISKHSAMGSFDLVGKNVN